MRGRLGGMRILFVGVIVGRSGRTIVTQRLPELIEAWKVDCTIINGENAAGGFGITEVIYQEIMEAGADAVTLGNHAWDQREALVFIERAPALVRPVNYPPGTPGRGATLITAIGIGFATQEIPSVPATQRDARLDLVLTEREVIDCRTLRG